MKASDLFVRSLEQERVEYIFGVPGEENLDFLESLRESRIRFILTRHEQCAGFMAATYGRLTGKAGVCLATLGPGATNLVTAAAYAQLGALPTLMITGQKPVKKSKQGRFQIVDVVEMMRPITKFTKQIVNGDSIPVLVREAVRVAQEERPGAVHLELPEDIATETTTTAPYEVSAARRPSANERVIDEAVEMLKASKIPLVLIGAAANRNRTSVALRELIDQTGVYFFNTQMGKGVIDERHPLFLGTAALSTEDYLHRAIEAADLISSWGKGLNCGQLPAPSGSPGEKPPPGVLELSDGSGRMSGVVVVEIDKHVLDALAQNFLDDRHPQVHILRSVPNEAIPVLRLGLDSIPIAEKPDVGEVGRYGVHPSVDLVHLRKDPPVEIQELEQDRPQAAFQKVHHPQKGAHLHLAVQERLFRRIPSPKQKRGSGGGRPGVPPVPLQGQATILVRVRAYILFKARSSLSGVMGRSMIRAPTAS